MASLKVRAHRANVGSPLVCNDGVAIAKEFQLKDAEETFGARMLRQAAERMLERNLGFVAGRKVYVDTIQAGIIDPRKVVCVAMENAVSVAGILLLTEATLTEVPERRHKQLVCEEMPG